MNMSSISLKKETAKLVLTKRNLLTPPAVDVALAIDISGSMQRNYTNGVVQEIVERCLALALQFDLDKKLDVFTFNKDSQYVGSITEEPRADIDIASEGAHSTYSHCASERP